MIKEPKTIHSITDHLYNRLDTTLMCMQEGLITDEEAQEGVENLIWEWQNERDEIMEKNNE